MVTNCPPFDILDRLTLNIDIALYLIYPFFSFLLSILHYRFSAGEGPEGGSQYHQPPEVINYSIGTRGHVSIATLCV